MRRNWVLSKSCFLSPVALTLDPLKRGSVEALKREANPSPDARRRGRSRDRGPVGLVGFIGQWSLSWQRQACLPVGEPDVRARRMGPAIAPEFHQARDGRSGRREAALYDRRGCPPIQMRSGPNAECEMRSAE